MTRTTTLCLLLALAASGCNEMKRPIVDQCLRAEAFKQCMKLLPAGPQATKYNDWDEVVNACENAAYYQSLRVKEQVPMQCRSYQ